MFDLTFLQFYRDTFIGIADETDGKGNFPVCRDFKTKPTVFVGGRSFFFTQDRHIGQVNGVVDRIGNISFNPCSLGLREKRK